MGSYLKFTVTFFEDRKAQLVDEYLDFWTNYVNPIEICVAHSFFECLTKAPRLMKQPHTRLGLTLAMYDPGNVLEKAAPHVT